MEIPVEIFQAAQGGPSVPHAVWYAAMVTLWSINPGDPSLRDVIGGGKVEPPSAEEFLDYLEARRRFEALIG